MTYYRSARSIRPLQTNSALTTSTIKPDVIVQSGIVEIDRLLQGFKAGEVTFIDGNSALISDMPNRLCVNTFRTFKSDTIYLDGGMCANPYKIARYARMMEIDQQEILNRIHISRAFTVYQLSTLIQELLEPELKRRDPRTLIIGMFPALYLDPDVSAKEARTLFALNLKKIRELTSTYHLITILTNLDRTHLSSHRNIRDILYEDVNEILRLKEVEPCIYVSNILEW